MSGRDPAVRMRPAGIGTGRRIGRAAALAMMLAMAGAGCQAGARAPSPGGGVSASAPAATVPAPAPAVAVPAPAAGGTYSAFCGAPPGCRGGGVPAALRRPIHLPHLAAGARCPVSAPGRKVYRNEAAAIGPGPI